VDLPAGRWLRRQHAGASYVLTGPEAVTQAVDQPEPVTHVVEEITGARARTFRDWARDHARDFLPPREDQRR
jgi:hypothetical protein